MSGGMSLQFPGSVGIEDGLCRKVNLHCFPLTRTTVSRLPGRELFFVLLARPFEKRRCIAVSKSQTQNVDHLLNCLLRQFVALGYVRVSLPSIAWIDCRTTWKRSWLLEQPEIMRPVASRSLKHQQLRVLLARDSTHSDTPSPSPTLASMPPPPALHYPSFAKVVGPFWAQEVLYALFFFSWSNLTQSPLLALFVCAIA